MEKFADKELLNEIAYSLDGKRQRMKAMLLLAAALIIILTLMRPKWGFEWREVTKSGIEKTTLRQARSHSFFRQRFSEMSPYRRL